jgi:hypothetical protein
MKKIAQQTSELVNFRNSIVKFHQNIKIAYENLKNSSIKGQVQKGLFDAYKPYLSNIATASVFGSTFTTDQLRQHLRYLQGIVRKLASINAMSQDGFIQIYKNQSYYKDLFIFGNKIKEIFTPLATAIPSNPSDEVLINNSKVICNLLDKVGANFVTKLSTYIENLNPNNLRSTAIKHILLKKLANKYNLSCNGSNYTLSEAKNCIDTMIYELNNIKKHYNFYIKSKDVIESKEDRLNEYKNSNNFSHYLDKNLLNLKIEDTEKDINESIQRLKLRCDTIIVGSIKIFFQYFKNFMGWIEMYKCEKSISYLIDTNLKNYEDLSCFDSVDYENYDRIFTTSITISDNICNFLQSSGIKDKIEHLSDEEDIKDFEKNILILLNKLDLLLIPLNGHVSLSNVKDSFKEDCQLLIDENTRVISEEDILALGPEEQELYYE